MSFGIIKSNQNMGKSKNYVTWKNKVFIVYIETENIYIDIEKDDETRCDTSNYELERQLSRGKNKKSYWID